MIRSFPSDIWQNIFFCSDSQTVGRMARICRNANIGAQSDKLWNHLFEKRFGYPCPYNNPKKAFQTRFKIIHHFAWDKSRYIVRIKSFTFPLLMGETLFYIKGNLLKSKGIDKSKGCFKLSEPGTGLVSCSKEQNLYSSVPSGPYFVCTAGGYAYIFKDNLTNLILKCLQSEYRLTLKNCIILQTVAGFDIFDCIASHKFSLPIAFQRDETFEHGAEKGDLAFILTNKSLYIIDVNEKTVIKREHAIGRDLTLYIPTNEHYCLKSRDSIKVFNMSGFFLHEIPVNGPDSKLSFDKQYFYKANQKKIDVFDLQNGLLVHSLTFNAQVRKIRAFRNRLIMNFENLDRFELFDTVSWKRLSFYDLKLPNEPSVPTFAVDPVMNLLIVNFKNLLTINGIMIDVQTGKVLEKSSEAAADKFENGMCVSFRSNPITKHSIQVMMMSHIFPVSGK